MSTALEQALILLLLAYNRFQTATYRSMMSFGSISRHLHRDHRYHSIKVYLKVYKELRMMRCEHQTQRHKEV